MLLTLLFVFLTDCLFTLVV